MVLVPALVIQLDGALSADPGLIRLLRRRLDKPPHLSHRHRKIQSLSRRLECVYANEVTAVAQQRAAGIAGIYRGLGLGLDHVRVMERSFVALANLADNPA